MVNLKGKVDVIKINELSLKQAHLYVLPHLDGIDFYHRLFLDEHVVECSQEPTDRLKQKWLLEEFPSWLRERVLNMDFSKPETRVIRVIAHDPNSIAKRMKEFVINGYRFHTQARDKSKKTQNYGVMVEAEGKTYYGKINEITELDYFSECKVVLFRCDWVNVNS